MIKKKKTIASDRDIEIVEIRKFDSNYIQIIIIKWGNVSKIVRRSVCIVIKFQWVKFFQTITIFLNNMV